MNHQRGNEFTVLMSVYVKEKPSYLDLSLQSVITNQTLPPNELVLVCDGPLSPELDEVINKYLSQYPTIIRLLRLPENVGLGKALNYGLEKCTYNLIARADSDDVCYPCRFEKQVQFMIEHPEIAVVSSYVDEFNDDWQKSHNIKKVPIHDKELRKRAKLKNPMNHMAVMFRRDIILSIGSYQDVPYVEDYDLWVRAMLAGYKFANIGECLVHARVGNGMVGRRSNVAQINSWKKVNALMLESHFISRWEYNRNIVAIKLFVKMPIWLKHIVYNTVLRKKIN